MEPTMPLASGSKVTVFSGASPHGQGQKTSFAQIIADGLGIDIENVEVIHGELCGHIVHLDAGLGLLS